MFRRTALVLSLTILQGLPILASTSEEPRVHLRHRSLLPDASGTPIGTVTVDFYRTYVVQGGVRKHAIPEWRIPRLIDSVNRWFEGRVRFELGDVYEYDNPEMYIVTNSGGPCQVISDFSRSEDVRDKSRISVVVAKDMRSSLLACVPSRGRPLNWDFAAAAIMGGNWQSYFGGSLAHAMGHIMGMGHCSDDSRKGLNVYRGCGLNLTYPYWSNADGDSVMEVEGVRYDNSDWEGRSNIMSRFTPFNLFSAIVSGKLGIYRKNYTPVFETITECWFNESKELAQELFLAEANNSTAQSSVEPLD